MQSSTTGQTGWAKFAGFQSSLPASWRSSSAGFDVTNGASSSTNQSAASGASDTSQASFDSMMATLLQARGSANGATGSTLSSGLSDDVQFVSSQTTGGSGTPLRADLQSVLSIMSNRVAASTANGSTGASSASNASTAVDDLNTMLSKGLQAVANDLETNASGTTNPSTSMVPATVNTAASSGSTAQTSPPWAAGWFHVGASTEAATTGWADPFGQQNGTTLNQQLSQAASAYAATSNTGNTSSHTDVTA